MSGVNLVFTFRCLHSFRTFMRKKGLLLCSWHAPLKRNKLFWETFIRTSLLSYFYILFKLYLFSGCNFYLTSSFYPIFVFTIFDFLQRVGRKQSGV